MRTKYVTGIGAPPDGSSLGVLVQVAGSDNLERATTIWAAMDVMAVLAEQGILLESARGPIPSVAELVAGAPIKGSWWAHPASHDIFDAINALAESADVVRVRLVKGKVTLVHRRVWPALVRVSGHFPTSSLASIEERHTASGAHRKIEVPFPEWVPPDVERAASELTEAQAFAALPACLRPG